jgi:hypothetical protein
VTKYHITEARSKDLGYYFLLSLRRTVNKGTRIVSLVERTLTLTKAIPNLKKSIKKKNILTGRKCREIKCFNHSATNILNSRA